MSSSETPILTVSPSTDGNPYAWMASPVVPCTKTGAASGVCSDGVRGRNHTMHWRVTSSGMSSVGSRPAAFHAPVHVMTWFTCQAFPPT